MIQILRFAQNDMRFLGEPILRERFDEELCSQVTEAHLRLECDFGGQALPAEVVLPT